MPRAAQPSGDRPADRPVEPGPDSAAVYQITNAVTPHSDDLESRMAKYLLSMLIRTICVVLVLVVPGWPRWLFAVGAVALPYVAVIVANNGGRRRGAANLGTPQARRGALGAATRGSGPAGPVQGDASGAPPAVITGVVQPRQEGMAAAADPAEPLPDTA